MWISSEFGKSVIIFGGDNGSLVHVYDEKIYVLVLGKGPTDWLCDTTIDTCWAFPLWISSEFGKSVIIFGGDNGSLVHVYDEKIYVLVLGKGPADWLCDTTIFYQ